MTLFIDVWSLEDNEHENSVFDPVLINLKTKVICSVFSTENFKEKVKDD